MTFLLASTLPAAAKRISIPIVTGSPEALALTVGIIVLIIIIAIVWEHASRESVRKAVALGESAARHSKAGDFESALADYARALAQSPDHHVIRLERAALLLGLQRDGEAIADLSEIIRRNDKILEVYFWRAGLHKKAGRLHAAINDISHVVKKSKGRVGLVARGRLYAELGDDRKAIQDFGKALYYDIESAQALIERAAAHERLGDTASALRDGELLKTRFPDLAAATMAAPAAMPEANVSTAIADPANSPPPNGAVPPTLRQEHGAPRHAPLRWALAGCASVLIIGFSVWAYIRPDLPFGPPTDQTASATVSREEKQYATATIEMFHERRGPSSDKQYTVDIAWFDADGVRRTVKGQPIPTRMMADRLGSKKPGVWAGSEYLSDRSLPIAYSIDWVSVKVEILEPTETATVAAAASSNDTSSQDIGKPNTAAMAAQSDRVPTPTVPATVASAVAIPPAPQRLARPADPPFGETAEVAKPTVSKKMETTVATIEAYSESVGTDGETRHTVDIRWIDSDGVNRSSKGVLVPAKVMRAKIATWKSGPKAGSQYLADRRLPIEYSIRPFELRVIEQKGPARAAEPKRP